MGIGMRLLIVTFVILWSTIIANQADSSDGKALCFRGHPLPQCKSFMVTEFGVYYRLVASPKPASGSFEEGAFWTTMDLGWMRNISQKYAAGGSFFVGTDVENKVRIGMRAKIRRWLRPDLSLDFAPGVLYGLQSEDSHLGFSGQLGLNLGDWASAVTEVNVIRVSSWAGSPYYWRYTRDTVTSWYFGFKLGSYPGLVGGIAGAVMGALVGGSMSQ